jgi:hypothetical protein
MKPAMAAISFIREDLGSSLGCQSPAQHSSIQKIKISRLAIRMPIIRLHTPAKGRERQSALRRSKRFSDPS